MEHSLEIRQTKELLSYLTSKRKTQLSFISILMVIGSLAEVASIGLVIPFLGALTTPESLYQSQFFSPIIQYFGISSQEQLLLPFTLIFIAAVIFSGIIRLSLLYVTIHFSHAVGHDLGMNLYRRTLYQSYSYHSNQNSSEIINGIINKATVLTKIDQVANLVSVVFFQQPSKTIEELISVIIKTKPEITCPAMYPPSIS